MLPTLDQRLSQRIRPKRRSVMYQTWRDLLFLHWEISPAVIQSTLPKGLTVDTFAGKAYIGLVPFFMDRIRPKFLPSVPWLSWFLEFNVRTYVFDENGTPGVWFYSLDCNQPVAVQVARSFFRLPYHHARMTARQTVDKKSGITTTTYHSRRRAHDPQLQSYFEYRPLSAPAPAETNSLEFFLVERYILFAKTRRGLASGQVHHPPYTIAAADVPTWDANVLALDGFPIPQRTPDLAHFSPGVAVDVFPLQQI